MHKTLIWRVAILALLALNAFTIYDTRNVVVNNDRASADLFVGLINTQNDIRDALRQQTNWQMLVLDKATYAATTSSNALALTIQTRNEVWGMKRVAHAHPGMPGFEEER